MAPAQYDFRCALSAFICSVSNCGGPVSATFSTKIILAKRSGNRCALPTCHVALAQDTESGSALSIGEAAHILGDKPGSARYDPEITERKRDHVDNLLYVCGNCHKIIDRDVESYPIERLRQIKADHEAKVEAGVNAALASVGFPELRKVVERLSSTSPIPTDSSLELLPPDAKIKRNDLGPGSRNTITMGLALSSTIRQFVSEIESDDPEWPDRLKNGFVSRYLRLRKEGYRGDELFELMSAYATRGFHQRSEQCAAISVLVYMFEACEVFER